MDYSPNNGINMYRPTTQQLALIEPDFQVPNLLPQDDWSFVCKKRYGLS